MVCISKNNIIVLKSLLMKSIHNWFPVCLLVTFDPSVKRFEIQQRHEQKKERLHKTIILSETFYKNVKFNMPWRSTCFFRGNSIFYFSRSCHGQNYDFSLKVAKTLLLVIFKFNIISAWTLAIEGSFLSILWRHL